MLQILAPVEDLAFGRVGQPEHQAHEGRLSAAALADDRGDGRVGVAHGEGKVLQRDRLLRLFENADGEDLGDVAHLEQRRHWVTSASGRGATGDGLRGVHRTGLYDGSS